MRRLKKPLSPTDGNEYVIETTSGVVLFAVINPAKQHFSHSPVKTNQYVQHISAINLKTTMQYFSCAI